MISELFSKKEKYYGQRALNIQKLNRQNLIFLAVAIIIVLVLAVAVFRGLSFLIARINEGIKPPSSSSVSKPEYFNMEGFDQIKPKLEAPEISGKE